MKHIILGIAIMLCFTAPTYADEKQEAPQTLNDTNIVLTLDGMSCEPCAHTVKKAMNKQENVIDTLVTLDDQKVQIDLKDGTNLSDEEIKEVIDWAGYDLITIERL